MPKTSLLIPCYNAAPYLDRFAQALSLMSVSFDEVIAYDDGSSDGTADKARSLGWQVVRGEVNRGVSHARNELARVCSGEWFHFHDADDLVLPRYLEVLGRWACDTYDVVSCDADWLWEDSRKLEIAWRYDAEALRTEPVGAMLVRPMSFNCSLIRKVLWERMGGCDLSLRIWEDSDAHIRLARCGARFMHVPEVHSMALRRKGSLSADMLENARSRLQCLETYALWPDAARHAKVLGQEAEKTSRTLLRLGDSTAALLALRLCRRFGVDAPSTGRSLPLRSLRALLPPLVFMRIQEHWREFRSNAGTASQGG